MFEYTQDPRMALSATCGYYIKVNIVLCYAM